MASDHSSIEYKLNRLHAEIATLRNLPAMSLEFTTWLSKLFALVEAGFGINSDEMHRLRAISPELPNEFYDSVADRLGAMGLSEKWKSHLLTKLNKDVPETNLMCRLHDYDDLIAAMIRGLQTGSTRWSRSGHPRQWTGFRQPADLFPLLDSSRKGSHRLQERRDLAPDCNLPGRAASVL
ncbi:MAG: hypothetical protein WBF43_00800 [Methylocella sp.]